MAVAVAVVVAGGGGAFLVGFCVLCLLSFHSQLSQGCAPLTGIVLIPIPSQICFSPHFLKFPNKFSA